jgi:hypothetical protein
MAKRINTRGRIKKFYGCEMQALTEALEYHIDFLRHMLRDEACADDDNRYYQHILAHCEDLLEEFRDGAEPAEEFPMPLPGVQ